MLSEWFLQTLSFKDEKSVPSPAKVQGREHRYAQPLPGDLQHGGLPLSAAREHVRAVQLNTEQGPNESLGLSSASAPEMGLMIPGCAPPLIQRPHCFSDGHFACSLIQQYSDLRLPQELDKLTGAHHAESCVSCLSASVSGLPLQAPQSTYGQPSGAPEQTRPGNPGTSNSDQGYLEMNSQRGPELSFLGLEPMSNSLLNGLLERHLEELYRQHFTDSLARCNSQLGHSLLRGLVPLLQPDGQAQASDSPGASLEAVASTAEDLKISYLNTTSHFSSPVLRISEAEHAP